jgi:hypothetical protein
MRPKGKGAAPLCLEKELGWYWLAELNEMLAE